MSLDDRDYMRRPRPQPRWHQSLPGSPLARTIAKAAAIGFVSAFLMRCAFTDRHAEPEETPLVNVNTATFAELDALPYVSPDVADGIIANRPYAEYEDLLKVPGIKDRRLDQILPYITIE